ncbi:MAG: (4Fe-4S)-binding protein [Caldithrix sp.]|nr:(4Fe-4S)-binding protein [Caldithrix sp.]
MKEIVIVSGKGGTGKTSITASFAYLGGQDIILADCDVDAADMHLLMQPDFATAEDFYSGQLARINPESCTNCGACADVCRFDAITVLEGHYTIDAINCEGCGYCPRVCPEKAISMIEQKVGQRYISHTKTGSPMVHARLGIAAESSGKLVTKVKTEARALAQAQHKKFVLVDGSPGVGCPVISSLSGAHFIVLVTEPTVSGFHDLKRVYELVRSFNLRAGCIINKSDLNPQITDDILAYLQETGIFHIGSLTYDESFTKAMVNGLTLPEYTNGSLTKPLKHSWKTIMAYVSNSGD